jgi:hypothetical protein
MVYDIQHPVIYNFMDSQIQIEQEVQKTERVLHGCVSAWAPL